MKNYEDWSNICRDLHIEILSCIDAFFAVRVVDINDADAEIKAMINYCKNEQAILHIAVQGLVTALTETVEALFESKNKGLSFDKEELCKALILEIEELLKKVYKKNVFE